MAELNAWLLEQCVAYTRSHPHPECRDSMVWEMFEAERPRLVRYAGPFDGFHSKTASVSKTCLVQFDHNKYDPWHHVPVLTRKPGAMRNGAPFKGWILPGALGRVSQKLRSAEDGSPASKVSSSLG